jgi:ABC-type bacteriocin/lantibiotic exporter with double-glycine peptidase domain
MEDADCGAACLAMVLGSFGKRVELGELRDMTGASRDGVSALSIVHAARAYGMRARGVRVELDTFRHLPRGSVLHWEFSHFVVFERTTRNGIKVIDPAHGRRIVSTEELRRAFTGVAIVLEPSEGFDRTSSRARRTWRYLRPMLGQSRSMIRVLATSLLIRLAALGLPLLTALVVDEIVPRDDHHLLVVLALGVGAVIGYSFLSAYLRARLLLELLTRLDMGLTMGFVDHLMRLPYHFLPPEVLR